MYHRKSRAWGQVTCSIRFKHCRRPCNVNQPKAEQGQNRLSMNLLDVSLACTHHSAALQCSTLNFSPLLTPEFMPPQSQPAHIHAAVGTACARCTCTKVKGQHSQVMLAKHCIRKSWKQVWRLVPKLLHLTHNVAWVCCYMMLRVVVHMQPNPYCCERHALQLLPSICHVSQR